MRIALALFALNLGCGGSPPRPHILNTRVIIASAPPAARAEPAPEPTAPIVSLPEPTRAPRCPDGEVFIPPTGSDGFTMGRGAPGTRDQSHRVVLTRGYCMDSTELTSRSYAACVTAGTCSKPWYADRFNTYFVLGKEDYPVNMVSWNQARTYCRWAGKRLPTEAEWDWAAAGPERTRWPWGDEPEPTCEYVDYTSNGAPKSNPGGDLGCDGGGPSAAKQHPKGVRRWPGGVLWAMAGNVWEWVEDSFAPYPSEPRTDPLVRNPESANHAIRGGGWNRPAPGLVTYFRGAAVMTYQVPGLGFRCARDATQE